MKKAIIFLGIGLAYIQSEARTVIKGTLISHPRPHYYICKSGPCDTCYDSGPGTITQLQELPGGLWKVSFQEGTSDTISGGKIQCYKNDKIKIKIPS